METWTKKEFQFEIDRLYKDMKDYGYTKSDCKKEVLKVMKDNNIILKG